MNRNDVFAELATVFTQVFQQEIPLSDTLTANDVEAWDSFTHVNLILAIELHFGIRLTLAETQQMQNVGMMVDVIAAKNA